MDIQNGLYHQWNQRRGRFAFVTGTIVEELPERTRGNSADGCILYFSVEDENGNMVTIQMLPDTYVVDFEPLSVGSKCQFWYNLDTPMPLIYPPRYQAVAAAQLKQGRMIDVDFYNDALVNSAFTLELNLDGSVQIRTANNQYFQGNPAGHVLVVQYSSSTRSIPAQTTPEKIAVLC